jgi:hypothetical protein
MRIVGFLTVIIWGGLTLVGVGLLFTARTQHGQYLSGHQVAYYVLLPLALTLVALGAYGLAHYTRFKCTAAALHVALLVCVLPFLVMYGRAM